MSQGKISCLTAALDSTYSDKWLFICELYIHTQPSLCHFDCKSAVAPFTKVLETLSSAKSTKTHGPFHRPSNGLFQFMVLVYVSVGFFSALPPSVLALESLQGEIFYLPYFHLVLIILLGLQHVVECIDVP